MPKYHADFAFEDVDGGTWSEALDFEAANDAAAETHIDAHAENWFQSASLNPPSHATVKAAIELTDLDADQIVMDLELTADHANDSGRMYRSGNSEAKESN